MLLTYGCFELPRDWRRDRPRSSKPKPSYVPDYDPPRRDIELFACVVVRVNDERLIARLDEYVDTAPFRA